MNLEKVRLVVSDMDGTLLNTQGEVSSLFFEQFQILKKHNIQFVAASGRQYNSIVDKLSAIKDEIYVIAENGGLIKKGDDLLQINALAPEKIKKVIPLLRDIKDTHIVLCGQNRAFIESQNPDFINLFQEYYHSYQIVDDLIDIVNDEDFLKIAVYHFNSSEKHIYPAVKSLKDEMLIKISGKNWLDISENKANKGNALREVQKKLNITKEETLVFGDYHNDLEMLQEASFSFAMGNAHQDVKNIANYSTESNNNNGVEKVLQALILKRTTLLPNADQ
ncbi:HAD family hydrolase [Polaribacter septentrionalilitoris]|uniref:HAD family hydrolase n=1 Tax=Polaribacter septentrionalilitoris TaxID=2494657 RepID=UPI00135A7514|nr:HAD family hydrolase [Polaribacter septentrionalilitoris]